MGVEEFLGEPGHNPQPVAVIQLPQHIVWKRHPIQLPEGVVVAVVVEVLVSCLEDAPEIRVLAGVVRVLAEQDSILIANEELPRKPRLTAKLRQNGAGFDVHIGRRVEQPSETRQIVRVKPHVRRDEGRLRMPCEEPIAFGHQRVEGRVLT